MNPNRTCLLNVLWHSKTSKISHGALWLFVLISQNSSFASVPSNTEVHKTTRKCIFCSFLFPTDSKSSFQVWVKCSLFKTIFFNHRWLILFKKIKKNNIPLLNTQLILSPLREEIMLCLFLIICTYNNTGSIKEAQ